MAKSEKPFEKGDKVFSDKFGEGKVVGTFKVDLPSDNDPVVYVVEFENGQKRHLKASQLD